LTTVSGIGHKIKSVNNPDLRVELVKEYVMKHFPTHTLLDYALAVEKVTTAKKDTVCELYVPKQALSSSSPWLAHP
jgi:citrate synthase